MILKPSEYQYAIADCDVLDKRALEAFRAKRADWLMRLRYDEHHAISTVVSSMLWNDASFRTISRMAEMQAECALHNHLLTEMIVQGHFATQTLAIRRLMDNGGSGPVSLVHLLKDFARNIKLFTRENYVCFDGLPYDYAPLEAQFIEEQVANGGKGVWLDRTGPKAWSASQMAHEMFDRLSGVSPDARSRTDTIPKKHIETLQRWLEESEADNIVQWTHEYLAHAASAVRRRDRAEIAPNLDKITSVSRVFVRVTEALLAFVLYDSGHGSVMPVPQFNQFEHMEQPVLAAKHGDEVGKRWDALTEERDGFLEGVREDLLKG